MTQDDTLKHTNTPINNMMQCGTDLDGMHGWVELTDSVLVCPVEVDACQRAAVVADNDAIRVHHRDYLKHEVLPQRLLTHEKEVERERGERQRKKKDRVYLCVWVGACDEVDEALHHP